jgi:glycosyltransferase involved in cell wall biosynthesis
MSNVALYLNPEAIDTRGERLMGRQSAGESFLRGYLRHSRADRFAFWNVAHRPVRELKGLVEALGALDRPVDWVPRDDRRALARHGMVHLPSPKLAPESWRRRTLKLGPHYGVTGVTHTTASHNVMDMLADLMTAPVEPWDAVICTSSAVRASVELQLEAVRDDLIYRLGARRIPTPEIVTIPLGINVDDFAVTDEHRARWRRELGIADDTVTALYVGRFNPFAKMNPVPMAMALERAAQATGKKVAWIVAGWGLSPEAEAAYHDQSRRHCPSVDYHVVDGRRPEARFSIWSAADIFLSLSDNIQETFGLTPVEAMAAGIPCVVSDWNGYRDTVRHGIDGFRVATFAPRAGAGNDLAYRHASGWISYDAYVGAASQLTAVDIGDAANALADLIRDPDLRRRMGDAAREQARARFDWRHVIPMYEDLWDEMNRRRRAAEPRRPLPRSLEADPRRLDPFLLFGNYATEWLTGTTLVMLTPGQDWTTLQALLKDSLVSHAAFARPDLPELERLLEELAKRPQITVTEAVAWAPPERRTLLERSLLWLAKYQIVTILPRSSAIPN